MIEPRIRHVSRDPDRTTSNSATTTAHPWPPERVVFYEPSAPTADGVYSFNPLPGVPTYFISGPMRNQPRFGFDAFDEAAKMLRDGGAVVLSPADHDRTNGFNPDRADALDGFDLQAATAWDVKSVLRSDAVVLLPGWEKSEGAALEIFVANAVGIELLLYPSLTPIVVSQPQLLPVTPRSDDDVSILEEADELIYGVRQDMYGHPVEDFTRTGRIWGAILGISDVPPEKVGLCMVGVKMSREVNRPKRDNRTDGAGYWGCVDLVQTYKENTNVLDSSLDACLY